MEAHRVVIVGAGQAGLSVSRELTRLGVENVILERARIGQAWRDRWKSFCLVTPNWTVDLPGFPYDGDDPDGFMPRDEIVAYLERYAASFDAPVHEGVTAKTASHDGTTFSVETDKGIFQGDKLVLATGAYQKPHRPKGAETLPGHLKLMNVTDFTESADLPPGAVLIIGSGQSGCQIAEELLQAGRRVVLACGRAPWMQRRFGGYDLTWWFEKSGFVDVPVSQIPEEARLWGNVIASGHDDGHDLSLRILLDQGAELAGHFLGADGTVASFASDLADSVAWGDEKYIMLREVVDKTAEKLGIDPPNQPDPEPFTYEAPTKIDLTTFGTVLFTGGFRPDYASWLPWQDAFDDHGFPIQQDGASTVVPGLYFCGVHLLRKRKSALLSGVGEDATVIANAIAAG